MIQAKENLIGDLGNTLLHVYPELEKLKATPSLEEQSFTPEKYGYSSVVVEAIETENLNITPSLEKQSFDGIYKEVTVNPIEENKVTITPKTEGQSFNGVYTEIAVNPIEENSLVIDPKNEQQAFNGVYTDVIVNEIQGDTLNITPTTQNQSFEGVYEIVNVNPITENTLNVTPKTSDQSFNGVYTNVKVNEVTSDIDKNIKPENIKVGANILGVDGSYEGVDTSDATALPENILQGKTAYANNEKITGTMQEYDGSYTGGASTVSGVEADFISLIDNSMGENVTKLPDGATSIGQYAFYNKTGLAITELPDGITTIGQYAFYSCTSLKLTKLPNSLKEVGGYAFNRCSNLTEITCEGAITSIGNSAFNNCTNLSKFVLPNVTKVPTLGTTVFASTPIANDIGYIYVPDTLVDSFKAASNWSRYETQIKAISEMEV